MPRPSKHPDFWVDSDECLARSKKRLMPHSIPSKPHFFTSKLPQRWGYGGLHGIGIGHPQPAHELGLDAHL